MNKGIPRSKSKLDLANSSILRKINVPSNDYGGVRVTKKEIERAFALFDKDEKGYINIEDIKKTLEMMNINWGDENWKNLFSSPTITPNEIEAFLQKNEVKDFDPVAHAFNLLNPEQENAISILQLEQSLKNFTTSPLLKEDLEVMLATAGSKPPAVSLDEYRDMLDLNDNTPPPNPPEERERETSEEEEDQHFRVTIYKVNID